MRRLAVAAGAALLTIAALAGCTAPDAKPSATATTSKSAAPELSGTITVYAAASLTATFTKLADEFEKAHPGVTVQTTFNGSAVLVTQLQQGAPGDVFASADEANMTKAVDAGLVTGKPVDFATNTLEIAVPPDNPAKITKFSDLARSGVQTVICQAAQPCGAATVALEQKTGVTLTPVSEQASVSAVPTQVTTGQADAGLVYKTDVIGAGSAVKGVPFDESDQVVNTYPIAALSGSANQDAAAAFVKFVAGRDGRSTLQAAGFGAP